MKFKTLLLAGALSMGTAASIAPVPVAAQDTSRIEAIEAQLRALQRKVFPGGDGRFFEPEIAPNQPTQQPVQQVGTPAAGAMTDVLARLEAIETQLAQLTAASEVNANALAQIDARLDAAGIAEVGAVSTAAAAPVVNASQPTGVIKVPEKNDPPSVATGPAPERVAAVSGIAKPATDDAGDDEYSYGFRLWEAKFYPEAQQQLALYLEKYPNHWRTTYARNLLGRAYLDAGDARRAATFFFENYQSDKQAARAPDSLLFLAESMIALGDTNRACIALAEFGDTYPALATGRLQSQYQRDRGRVTCK